MIIDGHEETLVFHMLRPRSLFQMMVFR
jgi:hypothetical protein